MGTDAIADPERLAAWVAEHAGEYVHEPDPEDLERVLALRESLRALLLANNRNEVGDSIEHQVRERLRVVS